MEVVSKPSVLPAEALFYALPYMSLQDLLRVEQVCRTSREWVRDSIVLWRKLNVERPLSSNLTDDILFQLSERSRGHLECLCLVDCLRITDKTVQQIVLKNPRLTKLFLPGCSGITADGIVDTVKAHTARWGATMPGLKALKLRNIRGLSEDHLQTLLSIMGAPAVHCSGTKPCFYNKDDNLHMCYSERPIDVEVCPKCRSVRMVYDCTREECQAKQECRACAFCTVRCEECGVCLQDDTLSANTVCFDFLCLTCWLMLRKCSECNRPACRRHSGSISEVQESTLLCEPCRYSWLVLDVTDVGYD